MHFRKENIPVMCDIEQMFHSFYVDPPHKDFLCFLWFEGNHASKPIIEYRMNVHLLGNEPSFAAATYGLCRTAIDGKEEYGKEAKKFICRNFYVDGGLTSLLSTQGATDLVKSAQATLATAEDRAKDVRDLNLCHDSLPAQRLLAVFWDLETDAFTFKVSLPENQFTRRGVLSIVNSVYDPLGFAVPVILEGRKILQQVVHMGEWTKENNTPP